MNPKTVLVTGSAGFIGGNFVAEFKKRFPKTELVGLDTVAGAGIEDVFYKGSLADEKLLHTIFKKHKPEYVFHFGAMARVSLSVAYPAETTHINVYGTSLIIEKARDFKTKRIIFSSSSSVYGGADKLPTKEEENPPNPRSPYAVQKYSGELLCKVGSELYALDTVSLRYFNVYGPGQYGNAAYATVMSAWLESIFFPTGHPPFIEGDGKQSRDFTYVSDVVEANIKAMECLKSFKGEVFNVGAGSRTDLLTVKALIEEYTGKKLDLERRPPRAGDVLHTQADISKAKKWFGYDPRVPLPEGLRLTIEWFKKRTK